MATADEILASTISDTDNTLVIDNTLRTITIPKSVSIVGVESDDEVITLEFRMPRVYFGIDLSAFKISIHYENADGEGDMHDVFRPAISSEYIEFTWTVGRRALRSDGKLTFALRLRLYDNNSVVIKEFNTTTATVTVAPGMNTTDQIENEYVLDFLDQWRNELFGSGDSIIQQVRDVAEAQIINIENKANEVKSTIPHKYEELYDISNKSLRTRANAIVTALNGEVITSTDCCTDYIRGLKIFGKTSQTSATSDNPPSPIHQCELSDSIIPTIHIVGKNLINNTLKTTTINGLMFTVNNDKSVTVNGTCNDTTKVYFDVPPGLTPGHKYTLSGCPEGGSIKTYSLWINDVGTYLDTGNSITFTYSKDLNVKPCIYIFGDTVIDNLTFYPMIRHSSIVDHEYEPFEEDQTVTISTVDKLSGIPVSSGGNYVDINGQSWICDEINLAEGVYIQRINRILLNGSQPFYVYRNGDRTDTYIGVALYDIPNGRDSNMSMCTFLNHGPATSAGYYPNVFKIVRTGGLYMRLEIAGVSDIETFNTWLSRNPQYVYYVLETPVVTALSDSEIFNFSQLHGNYPHLTVTNTANVHMEVTYNSDTQIYFNNAKGASDEQVQRSVETWLSTNLITAEGVAF